MVGRVLTIAGSDPSGGAGIQADIKTITMLGGYASAAITALTVQNTQAVYSVHPCDPQLVYDQIITVLSDIGADAIKTGMLGDAMTIKAVDLALTDNGYDGALVVDPVMIATSGSKLLADDAITLMRNIMVPRSTVLTPNIPEAEVLTGHKINDRQDMEIAGHQILDLGAEAVLMKGGHLEGDKVIDILMIRQGVQAVFERPKIATKQTHGTGCTLASAVATGLAKGMALNDAVEQAVNFVDQAIKKAPNLGQGHGPLGHAQVSVGEV